MDAKPKDSGAILEWWCGFAGVCVVTWPLYAIVAVFGLLFFRPIYATGEPSLPFSGPELTAVAATGAALTIFGNWQLSRRPLRQYAEWAKGLAMMVVVLAAALVGLAIFVGVTGLLIFGWRVVLGLLWGHS